MHTVVIVAITAVFTSVAMVGILARAAHVLNKTPKKTPLLGTARMHVQCFSCGKDIFITIRNGDIVRFLKASLNDYLCNDCEGTLHNG